MEKLKNLTALEEILNISEEEKVQRIAEPLWESLMKEAMRREGAKISHIKMAESHPLVLTVGGGYAIKGVRLQDGTVVNLGKVFAKLYRKAAKDDGAVTAGYALHEARKAVELYDGYELPEAIVTRIKELPAMSPVVAFTAILPLFGFNYAGPRNGKPTVTFVLQKNTKVVVSKKIVKTIKVETIDAGEPAVKNKTIANDAVTIYRA